MEPVFVAIVGGSGSGKTTLSKTLSHDIQNALGASASYISADVYYKPLDKIPITQNGNKNFDSPGAVDIDLLCTQLQQLHQGHEIHLPTYDYSTHTRKLNGPKQNRQDVFIFEGILLFTFPQLCKFFDIKIAVTTPLTLQIERRLERDMLERGRSRESIIEQLNETVIPMYRRHVEPSLMAADIEIEGNSLYDHTNPTYMDMLRIIKRSLHGLHPTFNPTLTNIPVHSMHGLRSSH